MKAPSVVRIGFFLAQHVTGQTAAERSQRFNIKKNIAIEVYDSVSYFEDKPIEGKPYIASE